MIHIKKLKLKNKILVITPYYVPSLNAGGPVQSIKNLVKLMSNKFDFEIITSIFDHNSSVHYKNINEYESYNDVVYLNQKSFLLVAKFIRIFINKKYDYIYLNSFFSISFSIIPIILLRMFWMKSKVIISPRGELSNSALELKSSLRKNIYIKIFNTFLINDNLIFHATSKKEKKDILSNLKSKKVSLIQNVGTIYNFDLENLKKIKKNKNHIKVFFLGRILEIKNLIFALEVLKSVKSKVEFNIYGPIENIQYWEDCKKIIKVLPKNISVSFHGLIENDQIPKITLYNHLLFLPTFGENFGHSIFESLINCCPVLISDQTPWKNLSKKGFGWDLSLIQKEEFASKIDYIAALNLDDYCGIRKNIHKNKNDIYNQEELKINYENLFNL